jgi:hypothetical protein
MHKRTIGSGRGFGNRILKVETLEPRAMLAGNVSVSVSGGNLIVRGDAKDNLVLIEQVGSGRYAVTGSDFANGGEPGFQTGPTRVNGQANGTVVVSGVTGDINVDLRAGRDGLGIGNSVEDLGTLAEDCGLDFGFGEGGGNGSGSESPGGGIVLQQQVAGRFFVPRNLIVNTGDGNDFALINADVKTSAVINTGNGNDDLAFGNPSSAESDVHVGNDLVVLTGSGHDHACIQFATVDDHINVQTGNGNDLLEIDEFDAGHVLVLSGSGNDLVDLDDFDTDREVVVNTGAGNDLANVEDFDAGQGFGPRGQRGAGFITVVTGAGNDVAVLNDFAADGVVVDTGAGNDGIPGEEEFPITIADASITNHLNVVTGAGNDLLAVFNVEARNAVINTGAGNDTALVDELDVRDDLFAFLGAGNDRLAAFDATVGRNLLIDAGAGNDDVGLVESLVKGNATILMGAGNDRLGIAASDINGRLILRGGSGRDLLSNDLGITENGVDGDVDVAQFEVFIEID